MFIRELTVYVVVVVKCSRRAPGYFTLIGETRLHLLHAIVVRLQVVTVTPETLGTVGV